MKIIKKKTKYFTFFKCKLFSLQFNVGFFIFSLTLIKNIKKDYKLIITN